MSRLAHPFQTAATAARTARLAAHRAAVSVRRVSTTAEDDARYILKTYARQPIELVRGEGVWLWDAQGKKYMDFHSGIAVNSLGHSHPSWRAAVAAQSEQLTHVSNLFYTKPQTQLAKQLIEMTNGAFDKVFFCNSGTEANEAALKFTRKYQLMQARKQAALAPEDAQRELDAQAQRGDQTQRAHSKLEMVAFQGGFHGRSMGSLSLTSKWQYRAPFAPLLGDVRFLPFNDVAALEGGINANTAGVFVEPIQGEGGVYPARAEFMARVRELSAQHGALLVMDEVQAGMSRTGSMVAHHHAWLRGENGTQFPAVDADIMTLAKPLAGGLPIGAVLLKQKVADALVPGDHGSTFSGGPMICAAASVVVGELTKPALLANVQARSQQLMDGLRQMQKKRASDNNKIRVVDVRGVGLLVGLELNVPIADVVSAATARGLMLISAGESIIRICPPLVISEAEIDFALNALHDSINDAEKKLAATATKQ